MNLVSLIQYDRNSLIFNSDFVVRARSRRKTVKSNDKKKEINPVYFNLGFYLLIPLLTGALIGYQLDKWFKTKPIFLLVGIGLGTVSTFYNLWRLTKEQ